MKSNKDIIIACLVTTFIIILTCCIFAYFLPNKNDNWFISITTSLLCGIIVSLLLAIRAYIGIRNRLTRELYNAIIDVAYSIYPIKQYTSHCLEKDNINSLLLSRDVPGSIQELQRYVESVGTIFSKIQDVELYTIRKKSNFRIIYGNAYKSTQRITQEIQLKGLTAINSYYRYRLLRVNPDRAEQNFEDEKITLIKSLSGLDVYLDSAMNNIFSWLLSISNLLKLGKEETWEYRAKEIDNYFRQKQIPPEPKYNSIFQLEILKSQALMYCNENKFEEALAICTQIENNYIHELSTTQKTYIYWIAGLSYMNLGQIDLAISYIEKYRAIFINSIEALDKLGFLYKKNKQPLKAIACYENIVRINEQLFAYWEQLGFLHTQTEDYDKAIQAYTKAREFNPVISEIITSDLIELLIFKRRLIEAQKYLSELGGAYPHSFNYIYLKVLFEITTTPDGGDADKLYEEIISSYQPQVVPVSWKFSEVRNWLQNDSMVFISKEQRKTLIAVIEKIEQWRGGIL